MTWTDIIGGIVLNAPNNSNVQYSRPLINGQAGILQTGNGSRTITTGDAISTYLSGTNVAFSAVAVGYTTNLVTNQYLWNCGSNSSANPIYGVRFNNAGKFQYIKSDDSGSLSQPSAGTVISGAPYIFAMYTTGTKMEFRINGVDLIPNHNVGEGVITVNTLSIGAFSRLGSGANGLIGGLGDFAFYKSLLDLGQVQQIEQYFANIYGITLG